MANQKLRVSKNTLHKALKKVDVNISVGNRIEPFYYEDELFGEWRHYSNGWAPAEGMDSQQNVGKHNSTDENQFHLRVKRNGINVVVTVGPERQDITIGRQGVSNDVNKARIEAPYAPYVVFMAVLRDPEMFLE